VTEVRNVHTLLLRKPEGKRQHTQEDNTKTDLEETMCEDMEWIYVIQNRKQWYTVSIVLGLPSFIKERGILWTSFATSRFSRTLPHASNLVT
jgi:hypothetical protein